MTITVLTKSNCDSSSKAVKWFSKNNIPCRVRNIMKDPLTVSELKHILQLTLDGTDDILATKSSVYKEIEIEELTLKELLELIHKHKELLRSPIILDNKKLMVGYSEAEIRQFIPRETRRSQWFQWKSRNLQLAEG